VQQEEEETVDIEYVRQEDDLLSDPAYSQFADIFEYFARPEELCAPREEVFTNMIALVHHIYTCVGAI
jgi:hypothetical protein